MQKTSNDEEVISDKENFSEEEINASPQRLVFK